jgi:hypothetical protein
MKRFIILILIGSSCFGQVNKRKLVWEENFNGKYLNEKVWNELEMAALIVVGVTMKDNFTLMKIIRL